MNASASCWAERLARLLFAGLLAAAPAAASAHKASDSYLLIRDEGEVLQLRWDVALRDLELPLGLDLDGDGQLRWGEVRGRLAEIESHVAAQLSLDEGDCRGRLVAGGIERRVDGGYLVFEGRFACPPRPSLSVRYALFGGIDPTHRGLLRFERRDGSVLAASLDPAAPPARLARDQTEAQSSRGFFADGVHHILIGYDHLLFLLCLLLPAVLRRTPQGWRPAAGFGEVIRPVLITVTTFTVAHSLTLALAVLGLVNLPAWLVEPAIAVTIALAALNNLRPRFEPGNKFFTFAFGLIHGFGFAGVLAGLGLPSSGMALALLQFNLGVEAGQLLVVSVALAGLYALRRRPFYPAALLPRASMLAMACAGVWFVERVFDLRLIS